MARRLLSRASKVATVRARGLDRDFPVRGANIEQTRLDDELLQLLAGAAARADALFF